MSAPYIPLELDFEAAVKAVKNYNADMPAHAQAPELTSENWPKFKKLLEEQVSSYWVEEFEQFIDRVMFDGHYRLETEEN